MLAEIKAMLKDATRHSQLTQQVPGLTSKIAHAVEIFPDRIYLTKIGEGGTHKLDGYEEKAIHVMTAQGPRTSIKRSDYVNSPEIEFNIAVGTKDLTEEVIVRLLAHSEVFEGLGASVSQHYGKYDILEFERLPDEKRDEFLENQVKKWYGGNAKDLLTPIVVAKRGKKETEQKKDGSEGK